MNLPSLSEKALNAIQISHSFMSLNNARKDVCSFRLIFVACDFSTVAFFCFWQSFSGNEFSISEYGWSSVITAGSFFGENKMSFVMIINDPIAVQIIKMVSYATSASLRWVFILMLV